MTADPLLPPPPPAPPDPSLPPIPWEERERVGAVAAFVENLRLFVTEPGAAFARMRERGDFASPLLWGVICAWLGVVAAQLWTLALGPIAWLPWPGEIREQWVGGVVAVAAQIVIAPVAALIGLFVGGAIVHLFLWMLGGLDDSRAGYEGTVRVLAYASLAQLANAVPFVGWIGAVVWSVVLQTVGLARVHRTTPGRAVAAVLMPLVLCCALAALAATMLLALVAGWIAAYGRMH